MKVGDTLFQNMLPIPFGITGVTSLRFVGAEGVLQISGDGLNLHSTGVAEYVEPFPGES